MINHILWTEGGQFILMLQRDCSRWAGRLSIATEDTAQHVHIENFCITLARRDTLLFGVLLRLDVDCVRWTCSRTQVTTYTTFHVIIVTVQYMPPAKTW